MTDMFHRALHTRLPVAVGGEGIELIADDGRRFIDACGGAAVSCLGHGHPFIAEAIARQARTMAFAHTSFFTNAPAEELAQMLAVATPGDLGHAYFVGSGSEAMEAALKMARQYHLERGEPGRSHVIARRQSYHGNTLGALAVGGSAARRAPYGPLLIEASHIDPCFAYRYARPDETPEDYGRSAAEQLETAITARPPGTVIAFVAETVVGATAGAVPPAPGYFRRIREICDRHGVLLILDEVMCGAGRTGSFLACEQDDVMPDIVIIAKGLGAGYQPIGAVLCTDRVYDAFAHGSGAFQHGHTYSAHAVACAGALAVQQVIRDEDLLPRVRDAGAVLSARLNDRFATSPHVGDIRGRGLFQAIELVASRETGAPFDPALKIGLAIKAEAFARGLMIYPGSGTIDGKTGDHVLLAPPYIVTDAQLAQIVDRLGDAVDAVLATVAPGSLA